MIPARHALALAMLGIALLSFAPDAQTMKQSIAHRGASAYAPEHTAAAYRLAIEQHADFVEQDLGVTRDGELICIHDDTLERTTNAAEVFPDRGSSDSRVGAGRHWLVNDFTLEEVRRIDAGMWFKPEFAGTRLETVEEACGLLGGKGILY